MAVNALGQTLQLLFNQAPSNDLSLGMKPGDLVQGRIMDLLPDNRAIIQIKGYNMLAQLPVAQLGQNFSKGVMLDLAVLAAQAKPSSQAYQNAPWPNTSAGPSSTSSGASEAQAPALTVKLLGISQQQQQAAGLISQAGADPGALSIRQPSLEALLTQAKLPVTSANLQAAQSLIKYGLPVDASTLHGIIQSAESLIESEGSPAPLTQALGQNFPPAVAQALADAKTLLNLVSSQPSHLAERPQIQALSRQIDDMLAPAQDMPGAAEIPLPSGGAPLAFSSWAQLSSALNSALNQVSDAKPQSLQNFSELLSGIRESLPSLGSPTLEPLQPSMAPEPQAAGIPRDNNLAPSPTLAATFSREVAAFVSHELAPALAQGKAGQDELLGALGQLAAELENAQSPRAEALLQAAAVQQPEGRPLPENALAALQQSVQDIQDAFSASPLAKPLGSPAALANEFEARGFQAPQISLSSLPKETVIEAVAFLKARQVPLSRPAVEAVASQLSEGSDLGQQLNSILSEASQLPQGLLEMQPKLNQEIQNLRDFLGQNGIRPEGGDVATQIRDFVFKSGMNLERDLAALSGPPSGAPQALPSNQAPIPAPAPQAIPSPQAALNPADTLKAGLLKLREAVQEAGRQTIAQSSPELGAKLEQLGAHISSAINGMHTLQLAARPTPAFDVNTFQIPVNFGGQLQSGQLSIYWKKGRPHELSGQDPVNVVFLLNTRGLGDVKVQLQVWKSECRCKVSVGNEEARKFVEAESAGLEKSFADNTPFTLSSLDIQGALSPLKRVLDFVEDADARSGAAGLNLTA